MSAAMRLPSRMGTMTLRSMTASDSSSFSVALRAASCCGVGAPPGCAWIPGTMARTARNRRVAVCEFGVGFIAASEIQISVPFFVPGQMPYPVIMKTLEEWDDFVSERYDPNRQTADFRKFDDSAPDGVREFYRLNHTGQTREFVLAKKRQYSARTRAEKGIWEALEYLNTLVDESDPDTDLSQIEHNLQTAEAIRRDGHPDWFQLAGLVHDLGKVLWLWGEPQWAVVGDTFPTGCAYSDKIVFHKFFEAN